LGEKLRIFETICVAQQLSANDLIFLRETDETAGILNRLMIILPAKQAMISI